MSHACAKDAVDLKSPGIVRSSITRVCVFCNQSGHLVRGCPAAEEYVNTGRVQTINNWLYLPTGQPIPNDGRGVGLQASVDMTPGFALILSTILQRRHIFRFPARPTPSLCKLQFEIIPEPARITDATTKTDGKDSEDDAVQGLR